MTTARKAEFTKRKIQMKKYYIAYGSNLNVQQMKFRCPTARIVGTSVIKDYQLLYKGSKTGSYLTIEKKKGGIVPVAIWEVTAALCAAETLTLMLYGLPFFFFVFCLFFSGPHPRHMEVPRLGV